ncbi:TPA: hypothetical protein ACPGEY_001318 [Haemophilus influenzae]|uniref:Uncharacterized protein n=1 Tax=Haemophilus influenzae TaxID=727 RepID=A0A2S9S0U1_HAEIF|nr:hypothetical protein [Haemophilus influenzae]MCK8934553.1 hypothetical protein [Haemophilus influenzae]MDO7258386.1 hypothetical protein [Haemophilus influenzae]MDO7276119.1 hypothetical protein [Haemophilus influenzae]PRK64878.1 hypothetical protein BV163_01202 [Haemophilus influenzae]
MSEQIYEFKNVADILVLDEKQFERFLADFKEWFRFQKQARAEAEKLRELGLNITLADVIRWKDDDMIGVGKITIDVQKVRDY